MPRASRTKLMDCDVLFLCYFCPLFVLFLFSNDRPGGQATNPAQVAEMLEGLTPAQRAQMAAAMGVSPQQLAQVKEAFLFCVVVLYP